MTRMAVTRISAGRLRYVGNLNKVRIRNEQVLVLLLEELCELLVLVLLVLELFDTDLVTVDRRPSWL